MANLKSALYFIDDLLYEIEKMHNPPNVEVCAEECLTKQTVGYGYIYLTSENLAQKFHRSRSCKFFILQNQFRIGVCNFDETYDRLYEIFSSAVSGLYMQKNMFSGPKLARVEETILELEEIIEGNHPDWQLGVIDGAELSWFAGEVRNFDVKQTLEQSQSDIKRAAGIIKDAKNVIFLNGAGLSVSAGIPDFRSKNGLYNRLHFDSMDFLTDEQRERLKADKQYTLHISMFNENPLLFYHIRRDMFAQKYDPTFAHFFQSALFDSGKVRKIYTQNIDGLLRDAGVPPKSIIEVHGTLATSRCHKCGVDVPNGELDSQLKSGKPLPTCKACGGVLRPNMVMFGEQLPDRYHKEVWEDCEKCDLLIITGTALLVGPVNQMVSMVSDSCPRLLVNRNRVGLELGLGGGDRPGEDLFWCGDADDAYTLLAKECGIFDEVNSLQQSAKK